VDVVGLFDQLFLRQSVFFQEGGIVIKQYFMIKGARTYVDRYTTALHDEPLRVEIVTRSAKDIIHNGVYKGKRCIASTGTKFIPRLSG
jgi:hypothetical protein